MIHSLIPFNAHHSKRCQSFCSFTLFLFLSRFLFVACALCSYRISNQCAISIWVSQFFGRFESNWSAPISRRFGTHTHIHTQMGHLGHVRRQLQEGRRLTCSLCALERVHFLMLCQLDVALVVLETKAGREKERDRERGSKKFEAGKRNNTRIQMKLGRSYR